MEKKEKNKIINVLAINIIIICILLYVFYYYLIQFKTGNDNTISEINDFINKTNNINKNGFSVDEFKKLITNKSPKSTILNLFNEKEKINKVLKSNNGKNYYEWLNNEISKDGDYSKIVEHNNSVLSQILPIFDNGDYYRFQKNSKIRKINLETFTKFIESKILKGFNLSSLSPIGIDNIVFNVLGDNGDSKNDFNSVSIGTFSLNLEFKGKNSDIYNMIDYIQNSGKLLIKNGVLESKVKEENGINNILMTIKNVNLEKILLNNNIDNQGNIEIIFYVKGIGYEELINLKNSLIADFDLLFPKLEKLKDLCKNLDKPICLDSYGSEIFTKLRVNYNNAKILKAKIDQKKIIIFNNMDINKELSEWTSMYSNFNKIVSVYNQSDLLIKNYGKK